MSARLGENANPDATLGYAGEILIRNRTAGRYSDLELRQLVETARAGLSFPHRVRITFTIKRPHFRRRGELGRTFPLAHILNRTREVEIWIPPNRELVVPPSQTWLSPGLSPKLLKRGYLNRPGMTGIEFPLFVTAHELCHAAEPRATFARSKKPANETVADKHGLRIIEDYRRLGGPLVKRAVDNPQVEGGPR